LTTTFGRRLASSGGVWWGCWGTVCFAPYCPVDGFFDGFELPDKSLVGTAFTVADSVGTREDLNTEQISRERRGWGGGRPLKCVHCQ